MLIIVHLEIGNTRLIREGREDREENEVGAYLYLTFFVSLLFFAFFADNGLTIIFIAVNSCDTKHLVNHFLTGSTKSYGYSANTSKLPSGRVA